MLYIQLEEEYRAEVFELIRLFLPESEFSFADYSGIAPTVFPGLLCNINDSLNKREITVLLKDDQRTIYKNTMDAGINTEKARKTVIMPLKLLIYEALSSYTGKELPWGVLTGIRPSKIVHGMMNEGIPIQKIRNELMDYYRVSGPKGDLAIEVAKNNRKYLSKDKNLVSIYIGIPFCTSKCLYCSFPSVLTGRYGYLITDYLNALKKEIMWTSNWISSKGLAIDTVYIGGGTPTALSEGDLDMLLNEVVSCLPMDNCREFTVEAGRPDTITREKLRVIRNAGAGRISINPQTMNDKTLELIGRNHSSYDIEKAFYLAREEMYENINMDLITGLPGETLEDFYDTLIRLKELDPENITVHTLAVKRASRLNEEKDSFKRTNDDEVSAMIEMAMAYLREMNMKPYYLYRQKNILANLENVGYSKPGYEGIYNILIMEEVQSIIALGAGGVSKIIFPENRIERIFNVRNVEQYIQRIDEMIERKEKAILSLST